MKTKIKEIFKYSKFSVSMCAITLLIGILLYISNAIGLPIREKAIIFLASFIPFFIFFIITILSHRFKEKYENIFKLIAIIISLFLVFYYLISSFVCVLLSATNPVTDPKYYNYYVTGKRLKKVFPSKIPSNAKNIEFYYVPIFLQSGPTYSLYYIDDNMTKEKFDKKYKNKSIWIGHIKEYTEKNGLLSGAFAYTPAYYENEDDYIIYLIEGKCDNSGYCNHRSFLIAAFNEETNEIVFCSEEW